MIIVTVRVSEGRTLGSATIPRVFKIIIYPFFFNLHMNRHIKNILPLSCCLQLSWAKKDIQWVYFRIHQCSGAILRIRSREILSISPSLGAACAGISSKTYAGGRWRRVRSGPGLADISAKVARWCVSVFNALALQSAACWMKVQRRNLYIIIDSNALHIVIYLTF